MAYNRGRASRRGRLLPEAAWATPSPAHGGAVHAPVPPTFRKQASEEYRAAPSAKWPALPLLALLATAALIAGQKRFGMAYLDAGVLSVSLAAGLAAVTLVLLGRRIWPSVARKITARKRTEAALVESNAKLKAWLSQLERKTREITLLGQMSQMLQTCMTTEESAAVIEQFAEVLFPAESGAVCLRKDSLDLVETICAWGPWPPQQRVFSRQDCWALRDGKLHAVSNPGVDLICPHWSHEAAPADALCVPMMAQGESLGVLLLRRPAAPAGDSGNAPAHPGISRKELAVTVAGHIALALANLRLRERLRAQSIRDSLTGLYNRRYLNEVLEREIRRAARTRRQLAVLVLDVDNFKGLNDTCGHEAGDAFLRQLGAFLQQRVREDDVACRYGGDEFVILLAETSLETARKRARQLREGIKTLSVAHRGQYLTPPTVSLGAALYPDHGASADELIRAADDALYKAKARGRDCLVISSEIRERA